MERKPTAGAELGLQLYSMQVSSADKYEAAFKEAIKAHNNAVWVTLNPLANSNQKLIAELAIRHRLPSICARGDYAENGCLMSYGPGYTTEGKDGARYVDKILKGAKPADIPVEQPMKFELLINLKTAKQIGVTSSAVGAFPGGQGDEAITISGNAFATSAVSRLRFSQDNSIVIPGKVGEGQGECRISVGGAWHTPFHYEARTDDWRRGNDVGAHLCVRPLRMGGHAGPPLHKCPPVFVVGVICLIRVTPRMLLSGIELPSRRIPLDACGNDGPWMVDRLNAAACGESTHIDWRREARLDDTYFNRAVPKSILFQHFKILREAGLIRSERKALICTTPAVATAQGTLWRNGRRDYRCSRRAEPKKQSQKPKISSRIAYLCKIPLVLSPATRPCRTRETRASVILSVSEESRAFCHLRRRDPSAEFILSETEGPQVTLRHVSPAEDRGGGVWRSLPLTCAKKLRLPRAIPSTRKNQPRSKMATTRIYSRRQNLLMASPPSCPRDRRPDR